MASAELIGRLVWGGGGGPGTTAAAAAPCLSPAPEGPSPSPAVPARPEEAAAATRIQAAYRGYRARRPLATALEEPAAAHVFWAMERIRKARVAAGRPPTLRAMSARDLAEEKQAIKVLLVGLDRQFQAKHGRMPTKREKERLRPIYRVYNDLKRLLAAAPAAESAPAAAAAAAAARREQPAPAAKAAARPDVDVAGAPGDEGGADGAAESGGELARLLREKRHLQVKLNLFEQRFQRAHGRPIKWESDISAVKADYEAYKHLKARIGELQRP